MRPLGEMNLRFCQFYNEELHHLRHMAAEFASENLAAAGRLALDQTGPSPDPHVERLLEGFAFMAARVKLKLDAEFPRFTHALLETVYPDYLAPIPSMTVVKFQPVLADPGLAAGALIPRGTALHTQGGPRSVTDCEFRTGQDVTLYPLELVEAAYHTQDFGTLGVPPQAGARAALRLRLRSAGPPLCDYALDRLPVYLAAGGELGAQIYEHLLAQGAGVVIRDAGDGGTVHALLETDSIRRMGFSEDEALLPPNPRTFDGYRWLREYFAFPQRFLFIELRGLAEGLRRCQGTEVDLLLLSRREDGRLERRIDVACFGLFCAPAINLFPKRFDRIPLDEGATEYSAIPDRTRPLDYEVYRIDEVKGLDSRMQEQAFKSFYLSRDADLTSGAFFTVQRSPRPLTRRERSQTRKAAHDYAGTEVSLSLVDTSAAPWRRDLAELAVRGLCTNRHLPIGLRGTRFSCGEHADKAAGIEAIAGPTDPRPSLVQAKGDAAWRLISHLSLNYFSLADQDGQQGAVALRELLKLYCRPDHKDDLPYLRQIEGLSSVRTGPVVRSILSGDQLGFARGLRVELEARERHFEGTGAIVLASVLERFFANYVSINSFTETAFISEERGEILQWPLQLGRRPSF